MIIKWPFTTGEQRPEEDERAERLRKVGEGLGTAASDADGQPIIRGYNESRRLDRAINELMGFLKAVLSDGRVDESEVEALGNWLLKNRELQLVWPVNVITQRVAQVLRDGIADEAERSELKQLFEKLTGPAPDRFLDQRTATRLPLTDPPPNVVFSRNTFVFTGKFLYGTRRVCEAAVVSLGGLCEPRVTLRTNYLVIGILASEDWVYSSHGRKIEAAAAYASEGHPSAIISEQHWEQFVMAEDGTPAGA